MTHEKGRYWKQRNAGLCVWCDEKATRGIYCDRHYWYKKEADARHIKKRVESGLCIACGSPLTEADENMAKCQNCRERLFTWR